jgi:hypothetical protein
MACLVAWMLGFFLLDRPFMGTLKTKMCARLMLGWTEGPVQHQEGCVLLSVGPFEGPTEADCARETGQGGLPPCPVGARDDVSGNFSFPSSVQCRVGRALARGQHGRAAHRVTKREF